MDTTATSHMPKKKRQRFPPLNARQKDLIRFEVLQRFLADELPAQIAADITKRRGIKVSREAIYQFVREGVEDGYLLFAPPMDRLMTERLSSLPNCRRADDPGAAHEVMVVPHTYDQHVSKMVASAGGEIVFKLIEELAAQRGRGAEVHVAFGIGRTTTHLVEHLAVKLRAWSQAPKLVVHAITPTFSMRSPLDTPVAAFALLSRAVARIEFVNLEGQPFVRASESVRESGARPDDAAFGRRQEVDIVVTGFADSRDQDGYLRAYLEREDAVGLQALDAVGWYGDVHLCPFTADGPHEVTAGSRAVTLFQLADLVELAGRKDKHVVLLCAPCSYCSRRKARALKPLLAQPSLRIWNHLVVDYLTAEEAVQGGQA